MRGRFWAWVLLGVALATPARASDEEHESSEATAHTEGHGGEHVPSWDDLNLYHGLIGEKEGVEPNLWFRPVGMPVPVLALLLNAAILYGLFYYFGRKPIGEGLRRRKENLLRGMTEASNMREEAERRLADYEDRLAKIDDEIERVRKQVRAAGEAERERVLEAVRETQKRMEADARLLVAQELKFTREKLLHETIAGAMRTAREILAQRLTSEDQARLAGEHLSSVGQVAAGLRDRA